jgi:hypothetical protein
LPARLPILSPWVDADLGLPASEVAEALAAQKGRRVVKTHTPADGFPIWEGVTVIAVYRHPLDVFFSYGNVTFRVTYALELHCLTPLITPALATGSPALLFGKHQLRRFT